MEKVGKESSRRGKGIRRKELCKSESKRICTLVAHLNTRYKFYTDPVLGQYSGSQHGNGSAYSFIISIPRPHRSAKSTA